MEKEYSVTVKASFGVMAESREDAERYILDQFYFANTAYTTSVEVDNDNSGYSTKDRPVSYECT